MRRLSVVAQIEAMLDASLKRAQRLRQLLPQARICGQARATERER